MRSPRGRIEYVDSYEVLSVMMGKEYLLKSPYKIVRLPKGWTAFKSDPLPAMDFAAIVTAIFDDNGQKRITFQLDLPGNYHGSVENDHEAVTLYRKMYCNGKVDQFDRLEWVSLSLMPQVKSVKFMREFAAAPGVPENGGLELGGVYEIEQTNIVNEGYVKLSNRSLFPIWCFSVAELNE